MSSFIPKKDKLAVAVKAVIVAAALGTTTVGLVGCKVSSKSSKVEKQASYTNVKAPTGTVTGTVVDTNGNPIKNAKVSVAGKVVKTNDHGQFVMKSVTVTNVINTSKADLADGENNHVQELVVSVLPPADKKNPASYLGALVTVKPTAQLSHHANGSAGDQDSFEASNGPISTIFFNGFTADAGVITLPALEASVDGYLRNHATGEALANTEISLDLKKVGAGNVDQEVELGKVERGYQTLNYVATTDENGYFKFDGLPNDSKMRVVIASPWTFGDPAPIFDTTNENLTQRQADVRVIPFDDRDDVPPYIYSVNGVLDLLASPGVLKAGIDGTEGITINFSEKVDLATFSSDYVRVHSKQQERYLDVAGFDVAESGLSATLTLANPLLAGEEISIYLPQNIEDATGNVLSVGTAVDFDSDAALAGYIEVKLKAFETVVPVNGVAINFDQNDGRINDLAYLGNFNSALVDSIAVDGVITQLNSASDNDEFNGADTAERLTALAKALAGAIGWGEPSAVYVDHARLTFTPTAGIENYEVRVFDELGKKAVVSNAGTNGHNLANFDTTDPLLAKLEIDNEITGEVYFSINNVKPGFKVEIREKDQLGNPGPWTAVELTDDVPPTTVLQNSYGYGDATDGDVAIAYGNGGELSGSSDGEMGVPLLNVTPLLFNKQPIGEMPEPGNNKALQGLYELRAEVETTGNLIGGNSNNRYTEEAFAAWQDHARTLGVAFSEELAGTVGSVSYTGNTNLSNYRVKNRVLTNDQDGRNTNADLVMFEVSSVYDLAKDDGKVIDFTSAVSDLAGNAANETAKVMVVDRIPAFITKAEYKSDRTVEITFDKEVFVKAGETIGGIVTAAVDKSGTTLIFSNDEIVGTTHSLTNGNVVNVLDLTTTPVVTMETESVGTGSIVDSRLLAISYEDVENSKGISWSDYTSGTNVTLAAPEFLMKLPKAFGLNKKPNATDFKAGNTEIKVTYEFNYPIDLEELLGSEPATAGELDNGELDNLNTTLGGLFSFEDANDNPQVYSVDYGNTETKAVLSGNKRSITFTLALDTTTGDIEAGDRLVGPTNLFKIAQDSQFELASSTINVNEKVVPNGEDQDLRPKATD